METARENPTAMMKTMHADVEKVVIEEIWKHYPARYNSTLANLSCQLVQQHVDSIARRILVYRLHLVESPVFLRLFVQNQLYQGRMQRFRFRKLTVPILFTEADPFHGCFKNLPPFLVLVGKIMKNEDALTLLKGRMDVALDRIKDLKRQDMVGTNEDVQLNIKMEKFNKEEMDILLEGASLESELSETYSM